MRYLLWMGLIGLQKDTNHVRNSRGRARIMHGCNQYIYIFSKLKNEKDLLNIIDI
jgi:hypothetical protein